MRRIVASLAIAVCCILGTAAQEPLRIVAQVAVEAAVGGIPAEEWAASLEATIVKLARVVAVRRLPAGEDAVAAAAASGYSLVVEVAILPAAEKDRVLVSYRLVEAATGKEIDLRIRGTSSSYSISLGACGIPVGTVSRR